MINLVSCGQSNGDPPPADLLIDCLPLPDPSPVVQGLPGTEQAVGQVIVDANPLVVPFLDAAVVAVRAMARNSPELTVVFACSAGWHRSVFAAEYVAGALLDDGLDVAVCHRDLKGVG